MNLFFKVKEMAILNNGNVMEERQNYFHIKMEDILRDYVQYLN